MASTINELRSSARPPAYSSERWLRQRAEYASRIPRVQASNRGEELPIGGRVVQFAVGEGVAGLVLGPSQVLQSRC
jgi:hypothetical protein